MFILRKFIILVFLFSFNSYSDENIEQSKFLLKNLGKQVVEKVSNVNLSENERTVNFRDLYLILLITTIYHVLFWGDIGKETR